MTTDFSRTFLREGYDMSEVRAFLADVERTIRGQESDPDKVVTAQKAQDIKFSVRLRGFNVEQVDAEIDRLIGVLRGLDREREWAAQRERVNEAVEQTAAAPADQSAPASSAGPQSRPAAPAVLPDDGRATRATASDIRSAGAEAQRVASSSASAPEGASAAFVAPAPDIDTSAPLASECPDVDRMLDRLVADPPIETVVDQVAAEFGTQEAVDEILRSMTQSKEQ